MKLMHISVAVITFVTFLAHIVGSSIQSSRSSHLSTFRTENLKIRSPPKQFSSIIDEAIWLMRNHFLKRHIFTETDWEKLPQEYVSFTNVNKAMEDLMGRFNDPYSRHIPETVMMVRQRGIRGEAVGIGVVLKRKWRLGEFRRSLRSLFFASRNSLEKPNSLTSDPLILPEVSSISRKGGHILSGLLNCIRRKNAETLCTRPGEQHISKGPHVFEHLKVSLHTSMPFIFAATCQHIKVLGNSNSGWNVRTIRLLSIAFGFLQICRKISPIICPIEITAVQAEGPSDLSGVEIGDQLFLIDGKDINNLSLKTINDLLCDGDVGDVVKVGIIRSISDSLTMPISADGNNNKLRTNVGNNDRYHDSGGREVSNTDSTNPASHDGHSRDVGYCVMESKLSERVDIDKKVDTGKMVISLDIVRDNIFSSKVSSFILSPPSYSTKKGMIFDNIALKGDIVASAGEIIGGTEPSYGSIGYISIGEFTQRTLVEVEGAIDDLRNQLRILCSNQNRDPGVGEGVCHAPVSSSHDSGLSSGSIGSESNFYHDTLDALVIDLRGNLGGTLPSALDAASLFLPKGQVLLQMKSIASKEVPNIDESSNLSQNAHSHTKNKVPRNFLPKFLFKPFKFSRGERPERYYSTSENADIKTPLLLLVDSQTASASEIFVAALMDNNRATCMGCKTVGKNIAQAIMMLSDGSGLVFTVREFLSPVGRYMGHGITPNLILKEPHKLDLSKIYFDSVTKKWELIEMTFADNCSNIFQ